MEIDFRNDESALPQLVAIDATTMNTLVEYCRKNAISIDSITVIHFGESKAELINKVGWATAIAKHFAAIVHFSHRHVPITAFPDTRTAAFADFERREKSGELIENLADSCDLCRENRKWHAENKSDHVFRLNEGE